MTTAEEMTTAEGETRPLETLDRRPVGGPASRLAEASKQLAIVLEGTDLDGDPELAESLTEAVASVHEAETLVQRREAGSPERAPGPDPRNAG